MTDFLDKLEALAKGATPGPWAVVRNLHESEVWLNKPEEKRPLIFCDKDPVEPLLRIGNHNAEFIASAYPQTVLALIEVARAASSLDLAVDCADDRVWTKMLMTHLKEALAKLEKYVD